MGEMSERHGEKGVCTRRKNHEVETWGQAGTGVRESIILGS